MAWIQPNIQQPPQPNIIQQQQACWSSAMRGDWKPAQHEMRAHSYTKHHCQRRRRLAWQGFAVCSAKMGALQMDTVGRQRASFNKVDVLAATRVERRVQHLGSDR